jgi:Putative lumazine-binding
LARALASGALLLALAALCLGGCGGGDSSESQAQGSSEQGTAKSAPAEANAEASIEGFGSEAEGSEREEVEGAFHGYLGALAEGDEEGACAYLAASVQRSLSRLAAKAKKEVSCPQLLEALLSPQAAQIAEGQAEGEITKVRVKGDTAFVVFHAPGARLYQLTLAREEGEWKATSLSASVLAPSLPG